MQDIQLGGNSRLINEKWFIQTPEGLSLAGSRCRTCGRSYFPQKRVCPNCFKIDQMDPVALSRRGKLYSFTIVEAAPPGFTAPYAVGYVDLPEGVRIFSPLNGDNDTLRIGMDLELTIGPIKEEDGVTIIGQKFSPVITDFCIEG